MRRFGVNGGYLVAVGGLLAVCCSADRADPDRGPFDPSVSGNAMAAAAAWVAGSFGGRGRVHVVTNSLAEAAGCPRPGEPCSEPHGGDLPASWLDTLRSGGFTLVSIGDRVEPNTHYVFVDSARQVTGETYEIHALFGSTQFGAAVTFHVYCGTACWVTRQESRGMVTYHVRDEMAPIEEVRSAIRRNLRR